MRRARVLGVAAAAAGLAMVPAALALATPQSPQTVYYHAHGVADASATCTTSLVLDNTQFKPASIGTNGSQFTVALGGITKFARTGNHPLACASIKAGDRIDVTWREPSTQAFNPTLVATSVVDNGPPPPVYYYAYGIASGSATCGVSLVLNNTQYHPSSIGTNGTQFTAVLGATTRYVGRHWHSIACARIKAGDQIHVMYREPNTQAFTPTLVATRVRDLGPLPPVHYSAWGRADARANCTTSLVLDNTQFHPASIGTNGSQFTAVLGGTTKFVGRYDRAIACAAIKTHDRIHVTWTEPAGTPFSPTLTATRVTDYNRGFRHFRR
jgi:hypothetical protein